MILVHVLLRSAARFVKVSESGAQLELMHNRDWVSKVVRQGSSVYCRTSVADTRETLPSAALTYMGPRSKLMDVA